MLSSGAVEGVAQRAEDAGNRNSSQENDADREPGAGSLGREETNDDAQSQEKPQGQCGRQSRNDIDQMHQVHGDVQRAEVVAIGVMGHRVPVLADRLGEQDPGERDPREQSDQWDDQR